MLPLAELQQGFARTILTGVPASNLDFAPGPVSAQAAFLVHRNNVMGALSGALRLTFPSVDHLVGTDFFDQAAAIFAESQPPSVPHLAAYGDTFPDFLQEHVPEISYLADVARLDLAIDHALQAAPTSRRFVLDAQVTLEFPSSLSLLKLNHPAELIKDALEDDAALAAIYLAPGLRRLAVWRTGREAWVRRLGLVAAEFLARLLAGDSFEHAFASAASDVSAQDALDAIRAEIFSAPFCQVISPEGQET